MKPVFVIVGASLAGGTAAITLRQEGFGGEVVLIGAEAEPPYERPPLSKQYLRGEMPLERMLVRPAAFYPEHDIQTLFGVRASRVVPDERTVELENGRRIRYDKLLLATGVRNRRPPIPGLSLPGVFLLRSVADADALRERIAPGRRVVVAGMGFIGCEVAASLRQQGLDVVGVDALPAPLFRVLGREVGQAIAEIHRANGVQTLFGDGVAAFEGDSTVHRVVTTRGRRLDCDFVVAGFGVEPVVDAVAGSAIETDNGVLVDEYCRTNAPDVFAAGDVANHFHPLFRRRMRVEHWQNAMQQGAAAARNMLGRTQPYEPLHWFWSDQYDLNLQYAGSHGTADRVVVRGALDRDRFLAFYLEAGRVDAIVAANSGKELRRAMPLIKSRARVDPRLLQDENVDLRELAAAR